MGLAVSAGPTFKPTEEVDHDFDLVEATGAQWVRFDIAWYQVQPTGPNDWKWDAVDTAVDSANDHGLNMLFTVGYTPAWARASSARNQHFPPTRAHLPDFATFVGALAERYASQGVRTYEIWNEPNLPQFWKPTPKPGAYTRLLKVAHGVISDVDPSLMVVSGGLGPTEDLDETTATGSRYGERAFLERMYRAGAKPYFDAFGHHPYANPSPLDSNLAFCHTAALHDVMVEHSDGTTPIWATEAGAYTGDPNAVPEPDQAENIREMVTLWQQWPFATGPFFVYTLTDPPSPEWAYGLLRADYTPKLAYQWLRDTIADSP